MYVGVGFLMDCPCGRCFGIVSFCGRISVSYFCCVRFSYGRSGLELLLLHWLYVDVCRDKDFTNRYLSGATRL